MQYSDFVKKVKELAEYIIKNLPDHIYKEDNILYPMADNIIDLKTQDIMLKKFENVARNNRKDVEYAIKFLKSYI